MSKPSLLSRSAVKKAGANLRKHRGDHGQQIATISAFRAAHNGPVIATTNFASRHIEATGIADSIIISRFKRMPTIEHKLKRQHGLDILRMQDIAGCRIIVKDTSQLASLVESIASDMAPVRKNCYLAKSTPTGYRGVHFIYRDPSNLWVELQIRTQNQHYWATAVEIIDVITGQTLKIDPDNNCVEWKRFFVLLSAYFAVKDRFCYMTHEVAAKYQSELRSLANKLNVIEKLSKFDRTIRATDLYKHKHKHKHFYSLIAWDATSSGANGELLYYDDSHRVFEEYDRIEQNADALLTYHSSDMSLKRAYPNYMGNGIEYCNLLDVALSEKWEAS